MRVVNNRQPGPAMQNNGIDRGAADSGKNDQPTLEAFLAALHSLRALRAKLCFARTIWLQGEGAMQGQTSECLRNDRRMMNRLTKPAAAKPLREGRS